MAFPTTSVLDDFNRSNTGPPPSSDWTDVVNGLKVVSNACVGTTTDASNISYWNASAFGVDQEIHCKLASNLSGGAVDLYSRLNPATGDGYDVNIASYENKIYILRLDEWAVTQLGATISQTLEAGDYVGVEVISSTIKVYLKESTTWNDVSSGGRSDGTYSPASSYLYIQLYDDAITIDDFGGGTVGTSSTPSSTPFLKPFSQSLGRGGF